MGLPEWCGKHDFKEFLELLQEDITIRTFSPNKGNKMNEHTDKAFQPMDKQPDKAVVHSDGTISVPIVEGDTYIDGVRQPKRGEVIYVQDEEDTVIPFTVQ